MAFPGNPIVFLGNPILYVENPILYVENSILYVENSIADAGFSCSLIDFALHFPPNPTINSLFLASLLNLHK